MDDPDLLEIAPALYRLRLPGEQAHLLNSYIWLGPRGVTLFDTGWSDSAPLIESALRSLGRGRRDVESVVLSHFHEDHAGAAAEISEWSNAEVAAGAPEAPVVRGAADGPMPYFTDAERALRGEPAEPPRAAACRVDVELTDGDTIDFGGGARVLHTPGHTHGSVALHIPDLGVVLTGDTLAEFNGHVVLGAFHVDRAETRRSALRIAETGAGIAGFGHGEPVLADAAALIRTAPDAFADTPHD
ncbi:MBL fold metallo-hydrolase [Nocardiopsis oceani]